MNELAGKIDYSGIDPAVLKSVAGPTRVFAISAGEIVEEDNQKPTTAHGGSRTDDPVGSRPNRFTRNRDEGTTKTSWVEATPVARTGALGHGRLLLVSSAHR